MKVIAAASNGKDMAVVVIKLRGMGDVKNT